MKTYTVKVYNNGSKIWYLNGKLHREDGPAVEYDNGDKIWFLNCKLHREDGPAIEYVNGYKEWYLRGKQYSEVSFNAKMNPDKELSVAEIEKLLGYKVKIVKD